MNTSRVEQKQLQPPQGAQSVPLDMTATERMNVSLTLRQRGRVGRFLMDLNAIVVKDKRLTPDEKIMVLRIIRHDLGVEAQAIRDGRRLA